MAPLIYLYGFTPADAEPPSEDLKGLEDREVELLRLDSLSAVVSRLPAETYAPDSLEARLEDLDWVAERGLAHERVVTWFVDRVTILPARLFTLYSSVEALRERTAERWPLIRERLDALEDLREWDLKVSYDAERLRDHLGSLSDEVATLEREIAETSPGRRYLLERKKSDVLRSEIGATARGVAENLLDDVGNRAEEVVSLEIPREATDLPVVLNAALLVTSEQEPELRRELEARARELEPMGVRVEYSGPWAPYRFVGTPGDG